MVFKKGHLNYYKGIKNLNKDFMKSRAGKPTISIVGWERVKNGKIYKYRKWGWRYGHAEEL